MSKCSCGVVPGDCYDACGARESQISDLINERDEARAANERLAATVETMRQKNNEVHETLAALITERDEALIAESKAVAEVQALRVLLLRYRNEVPLGHQPHMIAHLVDAALDQAKRGGE